ncbi:26S proteasome regulatory subunit 6B homolog [Miscanthus floridulus]|uniref:26S proteasome regulatory subunit 6B homolog n=1 Tax=Miscanthus floridulus TaxID=154761 RepID=UPI00345A2210
MHMLNCDMVICSVKDLRSVQTKLFSFYMFWFFIFVAGIIFFLNCSLAAVSIQVCTAKMNLSDEVDLEDYVCRPDKISAADIAAICQEAGMHAVRKNRYVILPKDFEKGYRTNVKKPETDFDFYK